MLKKVIIAPDKFKGNISAEKICEIVEDCFKKHFPDAEYKKIPVADGGDGTLDCFLVACGGHKVFLDVTGPLGDKVNAPYALLADGTAVIESAQAAGLALIENKRNPMLATTYGIGEQVLHAVKNGSKKIILALGGSATNDMGLGALAAMGMKFFDRDGGEFVPTGSTLADVAKYDTSVLDRNISGIEFVIMCDIDNPLYGKNGAAYVFAPQKGASSTDVQLLDKGLRSFAAVAEANGKTDIAKVSGGGAAGGMGAGFYAFLGGRLLLGVDVVLDNARFDSELCDADLVITGEGKIDSQTLGGKVIYGIASRAKKAGVPVVAICGDTFYAPRGLYDIGVTALFSVNHTAALYEEQKKHTKENIEKTADNVARLIKGFSK